jgi:hypothetical protein
MTLRKFNELLLSADSFDARQHFVHKHIFHGTPYVFRGREFDFFEFKSRIANKFKIGFHEIFIVGSGKLGFSYYKGTEFSYDSDIDVVLVNSRLFERYARQICDYQYKLDEARQAVTAREMRMYRDFLQYFIKGWMRPDKLPTSFQVHLLKDEWFDFFQSISFGRSEVGNYKVAAGLYKNYWYLEKYYLRSITAHYESLIRRS